MDTNTVIISGRLTKDAELAYTAAQMAVLRFTVANNRGYGEKKRANYITVKLFGKAAETVANYIGKGSKVCVTGEWQSGSYKDKEGNTVYTNELIAREVEFSSNLSDAPVKADPVPQGFSEIDGDIPF